MGQSTERYGQNAFRDMNRTSTAGRSHRTLMVALDATESTGRSADTLIKATPRIAAKACVVTVALVLCDRY